MLGKLLATSGIERYRTVFQSIFKEMLCELKRCQYSSPDRALHMQPVVFRRSLALNMGHVLPKPFRAAKEKNQISCTMDKDLIQRSCANKRSTQQCPRPEWHTMRMLKGAWERGRCMLNSTQLREKFCQRTDLARIPITNHCI